MQQHKQKLVIVGSGETARMAYEYFMYDSEYEITAFTVEGKYLNTPALFELPVVPFEDLEKIYDPTDHKVFVAVSQTRLNRLRTRLYIDAKKKGFAAVSYVSPHCFRWRDVSIGANCFIFENNVLQKGVRIGENVVLWSGNHVGHGSVIRDNCFVSSHVVISAYCDVGENCFFGVNSCVMNNVRVERDCVIGAGAVILADTEAAKVYRGNPAAPSHISSLTMFGVKSSPV